MIEGRKRAAGRGPTMALAHKIQLIGEPFNIAPCALLSHVTGHEPGDFVHSSGDAHIHSNHRDQVREPRPLPRLEVTREVTDLFDVRYEDFALPGYDPHQAIKAPVAV